VVKGGESAGLLTIHMKGMLGMGWSMQQEQIISIAAGGSVSSSTTYFLVSTSGNYRFVRVCNLSMEKGGERKGGDKDEERGEKERRRWEGEGERSKEGL
jgi:hypothetical protein